MADTSALREEICRVGRLLFQFQFISGTGGNISVRLGENEFLITPSKVNKGLLAPADLVRMDADCQALDSGAPSSEAQMHVGVYSALPRAGAVIHAHPAYATAFAIRGEPIKTAFVPEALVFLGVDVPLAAYATPSTREMVSNLAPHLSPARSACLLQNHGVIVWGADLQDAFNNLQTLELYAKQLTLANLAGSAKPIAQWRIDEVKRLFNIE